jgi:hypothetical protein
LTQLEIPSSFRAHNGSGLSRETKLERLTLVGSVLSRDVVDNFRGHLTETSKVVGPDLVGQKFGRFTIVAA